MTLIADGSAHLLSLDKRTLYAEDEGWRCELEDGSKVDLGIVFEAVDLSRTLGFEEEYPFVVEAAIVPRPEALDDEVVLEVSEEENPSRSALIFDIYPSFRTNNVISKHFPHNL